jgi:7-cyano-7-deazaguanine synthase
VNKTLPQRGVGVLVSGGLDSAILVGHLLAAGHRVQPFYIESHLHWQRAERHALDRFLAAIASPHLDPLVALELPLSDLYAGHWSVTGKAIPDERTPDEAVFLPGRNALLILKAALWCQLHGIDELALATLGSNPFADSSDEFFEAIERALNLGDVASLRITRPFGEMHKREVMLLGRDLPLQLTFSCIDPVGLDHCGRCNKCAERRAAFAPSPGPAGPGSPRVQPTHP